MTGQFNDIFQLSIMGKTQKEGILDCVLLNTYWTLTVQNVKENNNPLWTYREHKGIYATMQGM